MTWLHHNVSGWAVTSTLTDVNIYPDKLCLSHTKAGQWPRNGDGWEGNPWIFAKVDGQWYAGTYEWLRPGQICKGITKDNIGAHIKRAPLDASWRPTSGQTYGFMLSTPARLDVAVTPHERSYVVCS